MRSSSLGRHTHKHSGSRGHSHPRLDPSELRPVAQVPIEDPQTDKYVEDEKEQRDKIDLDESKRGRSGRPGHSSPQNTILLACRTVHRYSAYSFASFLAMHSASVLLAPLVSAEAADSTIQFTNAIYKAPAVEPVLVLGSLAAHVGCGIVLRVHRWYLDHQYYERYSRLSKVAIAGYVALPFVLTHLTTMRILPYVVTGDSSLTASFDYVAYALHKYPVTTSTIYLGLVGATFYHLSAGLLRFFQVKRTVASTAVRLSTIAVALFSGSVALYRAWKLAPVKGYVLKQFDLIFGYVGF